MTYTLKYAKIHESVLGFDLGWFWKTHERVLLCGTGNHKRPYLSMLHQVSEHCPLKDKHFVKSTAYNSQRASFQSR